MKTNLILIFVWIFGFSGCLYNQKSLREQYPDGLLTDDHSMLGKEDLLYDIKQGNPRPYNISELQSGYYRWQCFPTKNVIFKFDKWRDSDPLGPSDIIVTLCLFAIEVKTDGFSHVYLDRRARRIEFCEEFQKKWKLLTANQDYVCINGEPDGLVGKQKSWTWNKVKTQKGCVSLFEGDCDISGMN